jgi:nucleoid DNA-binding protein
MTKAEFIEQVGKLSKARGLSIEATTELIDSVFGIMGQALNKEGRFSYPGLGTLTKKPKVRKSAKPRRRLLSYKDIKSPATTGRVSSSAINRAVRNVMEKQTF